MDSRYLALKFGLSQLNNDQLKTIMLEKENITYECYYDEKTHHWWALAVGLGVPKLINDSEMTNKKAAAVIAEIGLKGISNFTLNPISGIKGDFYTTNRADDLYGVCVEIIKERQNLSEVYWWLWNNITLCINFVNIFMGWNIACFCFDSNNISFLSIFWR